MSKSLRKETYKKRNLSILSSPIKKERKNGKAQDQGNEAVGLKKGLKKRKLHQSTEMKSILRGDLYIGCPRPCKFTYRIGTTSKNLKLMELMLGVGLRPLNIIFRS
jgi:hypothetical protein